jgi:hypothetical protein
MTLLAMIPLPFAWNASNSTPGTTSDADYSLLIQSTIMTILGIFIGVFPTFRQVRSSVTIWGQIYAIAGLVCAIAAIPMYTLLPTMWSALVNFISQMVQAYMTLQLAFVAERPTPHLKTA